jgi:hypothetical protein
LEDFGQNEEGLVDALLFQAGFWKSCYAIKSAASVVEKGNCNGKSD